MILTKILGSLVVGSDGPVAPDVVLEKAQAPLWRGLRRMALLLFIMCLSVDEAAAEVPTDKVGLYLGCPEQPDVSPYCDNPEIRLFVYEQYPLMVKADTMVKELAAAADSKANVVGALMRAATNGMMVQVQACRADVECIQAAVSEATVAMYEITETTPRTESLTREEVAIRMRAARNESMARAQACGADVDCIKSAMSEATEAMDKITAIAPRTELFTDEEIEAILAAEEAKAAERSILMQNLRAMDQAYEREWLASESALGEGALFRKFLRPEKWVAQWDHLCDNDTECHDDKARSIEELIAWRDAEIAEAQAIKREAAQREIRETRAAQAAEEEKRRREALEAEEERRQLAELMDEIATDATMPATSFIFEPENRRAYQRAVAIAEIEEGLSELATLEGRVYRGLWFWSQFRDPRSMRAVFRGNRTVPFTAEEGSIYFHNGYPLERGHADQMGILTGWVRAYSSMCGHMLPPSADELRIQTFTISGPLHNRTTRLAATDVLRFQSGLMGHYTASRKEFQRRQAAATLATGWQRALGLMSGGMGAVSDLARSQIGPYLHALDDFTQFLDTVGCNSPTARQMSQGVALVARGNSLPDQTTNAAIPGAERVSDTPQKPGEIRLHSEICWNYDVAASHNVCGCLLNIAKERLGESEVIPASVDYRDVHQAFMQAPEPDQRRCRDPLGAISAGLLSIER